MATTIKDVAKYAGVNPSTVTRVIHDHPKISEETKRKVREAMEELNYHPNLIARSLVNQTTQTIGIIMPSAAEKALQNPFFSEVLRGISAMAHDKKYSLYLSTGETEEEILDGVKDMINGKRVDGIVLLYSRQNDQVTNYLVEKKFPFVVIGKTSLKSQNACHVDNDNELAALEVTEYLIQLGHQEIAFVGGSIELFVTLDRLNGYKKALTQANIPIRNEYIVHTDFVREGGKEAVQKLFAKPKVPTALVVTDDLMAYGVLSALNDLGINVPNDVSVISFNNLMLSEFAQPPLTSVDINIKELGEKAVDCLVERLNKNKEQKVNSGKSIIVPFKVVHRSSCQKR